MKLRIQYILSYGLIAVASVFFIHVLGFMTDFFILFMDGNDAMYDYFKDLQTLNHLLFNVALTALVMSIFLIGFDINKRPAGLFGLLYVLAVNIVNLVNAGRIITFNGYFIEGYRNLEFSILEGYSPSLVPFEISYILYGIVAGISVLLLAMTIWNILSGLQKGD